MINFINEYFTIFYPLVFRPYRIKPEFKTCEDMFAIKALCSMGIVIVRQFTIQQSIHIFFWRGCKMQVTQRPACDGRLGG